MSLFGDIGGILGGGLAGGLLGGGGSGGGGFNVGGPGQKTQLDNQQQTSYSTALNATNGGSAVDQNFSGVSGGTFNLTDQGAIKQALEFAGSALAANDSLTGQLLGAAGGALAASTQSASDQNTPLSSQLLREMVTLGTIIALAFVAVHLFKGKA